MNVFQTPNFVVLAGLAAQCAIRHYFVGLGRADKKSVQKFDITERILLSVMGLAVLVLPMLYLFTPLLSFADYSLTALTNWTGASVMVVSLWLFWRSHVDLGRNWSVSLELREGHQLVSHGVYRWIRHPMYASIWLWGLAQGMLLTNWFAGWSVIPAFAATYFIRMPREEQLMLSAFGESYRDYMFRTGRLIPRITTERSSHSSQALICTRESSTKENTITLPSVPADSQEDPLFHRERKRTGENRQCDASPVACE